MEEMFCFQCQQTAHNSGCEGRAGVCGKKSDTANYQDELTSAEPAVPYPAQSHPIWQKDILWKNLFTARKNISAGRWKPC